MSKVISFEQAVRFIEDGDIVIVSSSSGLGCPDRMLKVIGERFDLEGSPRNSVLSRYGTLCCIGRLH